MKGDESPNNLSRAEEETSEINLEVKNDYYNENEILLESERKYKIEQVIPPINILIK